MLLKPKLFLSPPAGSSYSSDEGIDSFLLLCHRKTGSDTKEKPIYLLRYMLLVSQHHLQSQSLSFTQPHQSSYIPTLVQPVKLSSRCYIVCRLKHTACAALSGPPHAVKMRALRDIDMLPLILVSLAAQDHSYLPIVVQASCPQFDAGGPTCAPGSYSMYGAKVWIAQATATGVRPRRWPRGGGTNCSLGLWIAVLTQLAPAENTPRGMGYL